MKAYSWLWMIDLIDESAEAQAVGEENKLVLEFCAFFARPSEKLDSLGPFCVRRFRLASESVQMVDEGREELEGAGVLAQRGMKAVDAIIIQCQDYKANAEILLRTGP